MVDIAVILPSRGLAYSETCDELLDNLEGYKYEIYFAHGKELPECFNDPLERAFKHKHSHYWIVEDDMILPPYTLTQMLETSKPIVAYDYPVTKSGVGAVQYDKSGKALFSGTGCLLIKGDIARKMKRPVFRTDVRWDMHVTETALELKKRIDTGETYGMHDVTFGLEQYRKGKPIHIMPGNIGQRKLVALGRPGTNQGQHKIEVWDKITEQPSFIDLAASDPHTSPLIAVKLKSGEVTNVTEKTAERLVKERKGKRIESKEVEFI